MPTFLPFENDPNQTQRIQLEDSVFDLSFRWNTLENAWYCSIGAVGQAFQSKIKVVNGVELLRSIQAYDDTPNGELYVVDQEYISGRPDRRSFTAGSRFRLLYFTEAELA